MSGAKHTPGPWKRDERSRWLIVTDSGDQVAVVRGGDNYDPQDQPADDRARLIAAAPELLEACEYVADWIDRMAEDEEPDGHDGAHTTLRAAIAKATGEAD